VGLILFTMSGLHDWLGRWAPAASWLVAIGTILLAAATYWLGRQARDEVKIASAEQRARDRPVVVVVPLEVSRASLDPTMGVTVPVLQLRLTNVGLAPALDIRLRVSFDGEGVPEEEVVAVLGASEERLRDVSLRQLTADLDSPGALSRFSVAGDFRDRNLRERQPITTLGEAGLRDEQREAERLASVRANIYVTPGVTTEIADAGDASGTISYDTTVGNNGLGAATNVVLQFLDSAGESFGDELKFERLPGRGQAQDFTVTFPVTHPTLACLVIWDDGTADGRESIQPEIFRELPMVEQARRSPPPQ
jgi:hypothetical protein